MKIDKKTIEHLEKLARIELTEAERAELAGQLDRIIEYCELLQEIDTDGVEPTSAVVHEKRHELRPDEVKPGLDRQRILKAAPDSAGQYFRVPKIIDK